MNETAKIYSDNYGAVFTEERGFLDFLSERADNAWWKKEPVKDISFMAMDDGSDDTDSVMDEYEANGKKDILTDTMENTRI